MNKIDETVHPLPCHYGVEIELCDEIYAQNDDGEDFVIAYGPSFKSTYGICTCNGKLSFPRETTIKCNFNGIE